MLIKEYCILFQELIHCYIGQVNQHHCFTKLSLCEKLQIINNPYFFKIKSVTTFHIHSASWLSLGNQEKECVQEIPVHTSLQLPSGLHCGTIITLLDELPEVPGIFPANFWESCKASVRFTVQFLWLLLSCCFGKGCTKISKELFKESLGV